MLEPKNVVLCFVVLKVIAYCKISNILEITCFIIIFFGQNMFYYYLIYQQKRAVKKVLIEETWCICLT